MGIGLQVHGDGGPDSVEPQADPMEWIRKGIELIPNEEQAASYIP